jgi:hypothetical protein
VVAVFERRRNSSKSGSPPLVAMTFTAAAYKAGSVVSGSSVPRR